ncbi:MAG: hypothetical protein ACLFN0_09425 [Thermovirgaceae bacterium]
MDRRAAVGGPSLLPEEFFSIKTIRLPDFSHGNGSPELVGKRVLK